MVPAAETCKEIKQRKVTKWWEVWSKRYGEIGAPVLEVKVEYGKVIMIHKEETSPYTSTIRNSRDEVFKKNNENILKDWIRND